MSGFDELLSKLPGLGAKLGRESSSKEDIWDALSKKKQVALRSYYDIWRKNIRDVARTGVVLSNGWAFSTLSGLASYEAFISSDKDIGLLYDNRSGEIESTNDAVKDKVGTALSGAIIYGYGNLVREAQYIEQALAVRNMTKHGRVYLIDCSIFYYLFALSSINPLRRFLKESRISAVLDDYIGNGHSDNRLSDFRNHLGATSSVFHIFLGNTFCNVEPGVLKALLGKAVLPGDVIIAEYAQYNDDFFLALDGDHVSEMASRAAADLFHVSEAEVTVNIETPAPFSKICNIRVWDKFERRELNFRSMLRRRYVQNELLDGEYELLSTRSIVEGKARLDAYRRLAKHD